MTAALEGVSGQQHAPAVLYPREIPGTQCTGGWVGLRAGLDGRKYRPTGIRSPDCPARSQSPYRLSYPPPYANVQTPIFCFLNGLVVKHLRPTSTVRPDWSCLRLPLVLRIKCLLKCGRFHEPEPKRCDSPEPMAGGLPQKRHYQQKLNKAHYSSNGSITVIKSRKMRT